MKKKKEIDKFLETYDLPRLNQKESTIRTNRSLEVKLYLFFKKSPSKQNSRAGHLQSGVPSDL